MVHTERVRKGFTLIELLVVIAVLGVLAAGVLTAINPLKRINQARDTQIKNDIGQIAQASQAYFTFNQSYPKDVAQLATSGDLKTEPKTPGTSASYTIVVSPQGCAGTTASPCTNIAIFAPLNDAKTSGNVWCFRSSTNVTAELPSSICQSTLDGQPDIFSIDNPVLNGSFETPGGEYGLGLNWTAPDNPNQSPENKHATGSLVQFDTIGFATITPKEGSFMQKVIAPTYTGISQTVSNLKPNSTYRATAWVYPVGPGNCANPDLVGVGMTFGGTIYTYCKQSNQWVKLTTQTQSDAQGKVGISFGNWTVPTFYVDAVRVEEVL